MTNVRINASTAIDREPDVTGVPSQAAHDAAGATSIATVTMAVIRNFVIPAIRMSTTR